jgi:hypothetical protein
MDFKPLIDWLNKHISSDSFSKPLIQYLQNQIKNGFFWMKIYNPKDISDPIVQAINKKEYESVDPELISEPIVSALEDATQAIKEIVIPKITIPEVDFSAVISTLRELIDKKDKDVIIKQGDIKIKIDTDKILQVIKKIEQKKPVEQIDYTPILSEMCDLLEGIDRPVDLTRIEKFLETFKIPELPLEDGRVKVTIPDEELAKMRSRFFNSEQVRNKDNVQINPATEDKQDDIIGSIESLPHIDDYDTLSVDTSDESNITLTYKKDGITIDTKTVQIV